MGTWTSLGRENRIDLLDGLGVSGVGRKKDQVWISEIIIWRERGLKLRDIWRMVWKQFSGNFLKSVEVILVRSPRNGL